MNIQEAAKLVKAGRFVRRSSWKDTTQHAYQEFNQLWICEGWPGLLGGSRGSLSYKAHLHLEDLTADDWEEILPPTIKKEEEPTISATSQRLDLL